MNRVYKVIWSKAKHCYVVTSEIAKSHTKGESTGRGLKKLAAALLVAAALMGPNFAWAADPTVKVNDASGVEQTVYTKDGADVIFATKTDLDAKANADKDGKVTAASGIIGTVDITSAGAVSGVTDLTVSGDVEAVGNLKVGNGNFTVYGNTGNVTTGNATIGDDLTVKGDTEMKGDLSVKGNLFAGGDTETDAKAALNADGSIKGAEGKFTVGTDGKVTAASGKIGNVDITSDGALTGVRSLGVENINAGGTITGNKLTDGVASLQAGNLNTTGNINAHDINAHDIVATGDISGKAISGTTITGTSLNTQGGDISGGDITATGLNTKGGEINGGDIKSSGTIHADGKITGNGLDAGSGAINGGSLSVTGTMEGNSLTLKGGDLDAGSGTITTTGDINGNNINANGKITTTSLEVTGGLKTDHITLGSETNNYTDINKGNVTSEVDEKVSGVEYTAESIFNKDGSSITARADVGGPADSTGKSIVGAKEISQYLGDAALPDDSKKNVTRSMVRNGDTFYMEDKAVEGTKSSTVSQNAGERKVTVAEGTNTLTVTENLTGGIVSETKGDDGTVTLTQGMDGTYKVETSGNSTEVIGGQKIENYNGGLDTNITGNETHHVTKNQTITVTGKSSLSAADIENKASSSIWNHVGEGYNTSWKMTDGKISESIVNGTASNKENTTVDGTKRIITNDTDKVTGTYNQTATSNNISLKNAAGDTSFTKSESLLKGEKTSVTNPNGSSTINQSAESIVNFVKNSKGHTTRTEQSAEDITNTAKNGTITNDAKDVLNKGTNSVINEVGANQVAVKTDSVKAAYGSDTYTTWDDKGITSNTSGNMSNTVGGDLINTVTGDSSLSATNIKNKASTSITSQIGEDGKVKSEMNAEGISNTAEDGTITNDAKTVKTITGNNTVTSKTEGTTFVNTGANAALKKGKEQGSRTETRIFGNQVETGKVETDFADVNNNLTVGGSTTLGRDENTTLTVNSKSTFKDTVKMDKTLEVDGESTFNNKVTITKGGLDVKGGTTTDSLKVTGTSEFGGKAAFKDDVSMDKKLTVKGAAEFKDDVSMGKNLTVTGKTETGILHVNGDGYVGGNLNVEGNIETHDAVLSADSRQVVTGRQLYQTNERVDRLDNRIKKVGANAAALAALRPGDFNPDDKFSIAAGFGSYRNANAAALGLFYRPNENVLLSLGTSFGDGENMVNAGVSVKFGRGKSMAERRKEMADEVSSMRDEMRSQDERIAELEEMLKKQSELIEKLSKES
ncbi:ESPR-type extended signal peptide-containing protein [Dialister succinatiphilus]|uniref:ESPR-type extended signal peptide-containing protein n=1 Tax=Dialister succinatiphilus TaxID=487173 RepID=UPI003F7D5531